MARSNILVALLVAALVAYHPIFAQEEIAPSSGEGDSADIAFAPEGSIDEEADAPTTGYDEGYDEEILSDLTPRQKQLILSNCAWDMIGKCREEVFQNLVIDTSVSKECCRELLEIGQDCHLGMSRLVFASNDLKPYASKAIPRSKQLWNRCVQDLGEGIGAPL